MTLERATGVILRTRPLTETSLIIEWITPDLGRLATVAKGARRPKSTFRGCLDLFYMAEFSFQRSRSSGLHTLREVKLLDANAGLRREMEHLQQASHCSTLIEQTTETETPLPEIYETFATLLRELPLHLAAPQTIYAFEMKLLAELGLQPNLEEKTVSPGSRQLLARFVELDWPRIFQLRPSPSQTDEMRRFLHGFLIYHLGRIPKGRDARLFKNLENRIVKLKDDQ